MSKLTEGSGNLSEGDLNYDLLIWVEESVRNTIEDLSYLKGCSQSSVVNELLILGIRSLLGDAELKKQKGGNRHEVFYQG